MQVTEILSEIKNLKFSNLSESDFWKTFLSNIVELNKSKFALILNLEDENWALKESYNFEDFKEHHQEILQLGVSIATRALKSGFSYERLRLKWTSSNSLMGVGIKIDSMNDDLVLFLFMEHESATTFNNALARLSIFSDTYLSYLKNNSQLTVVDALDAKDEKSGDSFKDVVEITSLLIYKKKFLLSTLALVNELVTRFNCSKVSIGWKKREYVEAVSISHRENFIRKTEVIDKLEAVYEECYDQNQEIHYPNIEDNFTIVYAHEEYLKDNGSNEILSLPLRNGEDILGVILLEKEEGGFSDDDLLLIRLIANQVTPILNATYVQDRGIFAKLKYRAKEYLSWWLGVNDTLVKFLVITMSAILFTISIVDMNYKIESLGAITTDNISFVSTPFDSIVYEVDVHSGDIVKQGDKLLSLDTKELYLKYSEALADVSRYSIEEQKSRGSNELADMQMARAKTNQAIATKKRVEYYLNQSNIKSSIDGVIVEGDYEELLGKPVSKGDMLFKIAQLSEFYLTLNVSEEYIHELSVGKKGKFAFLGKTDEKIEFIIDKIIPIATVDSDQKNSFVVKGLLLEEAKDWWRPGMSGVAKIEVGDRKIIWVLTHKFVDFIHLFFWI